MDDPDPRVFLVTGMAALLFAFSPVQNSHTASQAFDCADVFVKEAELRYGSFGKRPKE